MKKLLICLLTLLLTLGLTAFAETMEIVQKELLPETTTTALSVNDFVTDTEYPYETVGYFLNDVAFLGEDAMEVSITFTGNYGSNEYFFSKCYIPVYDYESGKLLDIFYSDVELERPFANSSRTTIKRVISTKNIDADIYKIKVIMLESLTSLRPNCPVPYLANELVISKNDIKQELPTVKITTKLHSVPLSNDSPYIALGAWYNAEYSDAAIAMGYQNYLVIPATVHCNNFDLKPYQGLVCDLVLDLSDDTNVKILSVTPTEGKNVEVTIEPEMLANKYNAGYVEYYKTNDDDRVSKIKLEGTPATYVNLETGTYATDVVVGGNSGDVAYRFVDTDNNGAYDTVFVDNEKVFVVGSVNAQSGKIFRSTDANALTTFFGASLTLDSEDETIAWSIKDSKGNKLDIADIKAGDIVAVKESNVGSDIYYEITVSNETVEGVVAETFTETAKVGGATLNKFKIGDADYMLLDGSAMTPGDYIIAKIYNGKVISYTVISDAQYGVIIAANRAEGFGATYQLQVLNQNGEIVALNFANKVNGVTPSYATTSSLYAAFPKGDIIAYQTNQAGEIEAIDVETGYVAASANVLDYDDKIATNVISEYKEFSEKLGSYYITDNTIFFATETAKAFITKENVAIVSKDILTEDVSYSYSVIYNSDKEAKVVVLYEIANFSEEPEIPEELSGIQFGMVIAANRAEDFGVTYQLQVLDQNGEIVTLDFANKVNGVTPSYATTSSLYAAFPKGDIIAYQTNQTGEIKAIDVETGYVAASANVLDSTDRIASSIVSEYLEASEKLGTYQITDNTIFFVTETAKSSITKENVALSSKDILLEDTNYTYSVVYNEEKEAKVIVLFAATGQINFNSYPLVITKTSTVAMADGTTRTKFTGYVNGEETQIIAAENVNAEVYSLTVGDIAMYATNREGELTKAYTLADKTSAGIVVKANYADDDEDGDVAGNLVTLSTTDTTAAGCMTVGAAETLKGFGAAGKAYKVQGNILRLVKAADYAATFNGSFSRDYTNVVDEDMIQDYYVDTNTVAYLYNAWTNKYQLTTLLGVESDYNTADYLTGTQIDNDDLIYVYNYDGGTKLILIVDVMVDNL